MSSGFRSRRAASWPIDGNLRPTWMPRRERLDHRRDVAPTSIMTKLVSEGMYSADLSRSSSAQSQRRESFSRLPVIG
jgi:hypothetical protein